MFEVSEQVLRKLRTVGDEGQRWLDRLPFLVGELAAEWDCRVEGRLDGGSGSFVANAIARDGTAAILKIAIPSGAEGHGEFEQEAIALALGEEDSYVRVFEVDHRRRAMLQERLGSPLSEAGLAVEDQIEILAATLRRSWRQTPETTLLPTGAQKARWLGDFIASRWESLGRPCDEQTVHRVLAYVENRVAAFDPVAAVLIHGDAHPANVLEHGSSERRRFKLIDPEGLVSEPAHDLGIPLRGWSDVLLAGDAIQLGLSWCHRMSDLTGVDVDAIWQWANIERMSTGLLLTNLGDPTGARFLAVADEWSDSSP